MKQTLYAKVEYHYENIPKWLQDFVAKRFILHYNEVVAVFNAHINEVNSEWKSTGELYAFGDYLEDINPEYVKYVQKRIQPSINIVNKRFYLCRYKIDNYGGLVGFIPFIKDSKIWLTWKLLEKDF